MSLTFSTPAQFANAASSQTSTVVTSSNLTINAGDTVIVVCRGTSSGLAVATVTDTLGNTYTLRDSSGHGGGGQGIAIFDCVNATGGSSAITGTSTSAMVAIWAVSVSGLTTTPFQAASGNETQGGGAAGTDNLSSASITVASQPALRFCFALDFNAEGTATAAPVAGTGWTSLGTTWGALGSSSNPVANPIYKELLATGANQAKFSLVTANKSDFFWFEDAAYTESAVGVSLSRLESLNRGVSRGVNRGVA